MSLATTVTVSRGLETQINTATPVVNVEGGDCEKLLASLSAAGGWALPPGLKFIEGCKTPAGRPPVVLAAAAGNAAVIEELAGAGFDVNEVGFD